MSIKDKKSTNKKVRKNKSKYKENKLSIIISFIKKYKNILLVIFCFGLDILLAIWCAKNNYINYAKIENKLILVSDVKYLLFGRNYVGILITCFIYFYGILINKFLCKKKLNVIKLVIGFIVLFLLNILLFYLFSNKMY